MSMWFIDLFLNSGGADVGKALHKINKNVPKRNNGCVTIIALIICAALAYMMYSRYQCAQATGSWTECGYYSAEQILEMRKSPNDLKEVEK